MPKRWWRMPPARRSTPIRAARMAWARGRSRSNSTFPEGGRLLIQKLLVIAEVAGQAVLYLLIALSVLSIGIIAERWIWFRRRRVDARALGRALVEKLRAGDVRGAIGLCEKERAVEADVLKEALAWWDHGSASVEQVLAGGVQDRRKAFESGLLFLGT